MHGTADSAGGNTLPTRTTVNARGGYDDETNLDARGRQVERELRLERDVQDEQRNDLKTSIERQFGAFKRGWPMEAVDLDETLALAVEYLALLTSSRLATGGRTRLTIATSDACHRF